MELALDPISLFLIGESKRVKWMKIQIRVEGFFSSTALQNELFYLTLFGSIK